MFEPQYICITSFPEDPIRKLIALRLRNLNDKDAQLNKNFNFIQQQLRHHQQLYRKSPQFLLCDQKDSQKVLQNLLMQLQLNNFKCLNNQKVLKQTSNGSKIIQNSKNQSQFNTNQKITPYHFTKFRNSLTKFSLSCSKEKDKLKWNKLKENDRIECLNNVNNQIKFLKQRQRSIEKSLGRKIIDCSKGINSKNF